MHSPRSGRNPRCIHFCFFPSATLLVPEPHAEAIVRQDAFAAVVCQRHCGNFHLPQSSTSNGDLLEGRVAAALALNHGGPLVRAVTH